MLTRSGLALAIAALVSAVCGFWWHYEELVIGAALLTVAIVAAVWSSRIGHRAKIVRTITSPRVARGEPVRAIYRATNASRRRSVSATIIDRCGDEVIGVALPAIAADDRTEVVGLIPTRRRGVFEVGPWAIERIDPLGLAFGRRTSDAVGVVLVHPRVHPLNGPYGAMHTIEDEATIRRTASDPMSGFVSLREYVDGDDPRLIHWPTSARLGTLMLREHVELRRPEFTVVLDAAATAGSADDFEEMVDVTASVAVHARRSGVNVGLRTTSRQFPGALRPLTQDLQILDLLTSVEQAQGPQVMSLAEIFRSGLDHTAIVFVTGPTGPSSSFSHTDRLAVVRIGEAAAPGPGIMMAVSNAEEFARRWKPWR